MRIDVVSSILVGVLCSVNALAADGAQLFADNCAACHQADGAGFAGLAPPLRTDLWRRLGSRSRTYLASVLVSGLAGVPLDGARYGAAMPSWAQLSDVELAAIGSFVLQKLNGEKQGLNAAAIQQARTANRDNRALQSLREGGDS
jgi:mono/diheme cytochrome c family protein